MKNIELANTYGVAGTSALKPQPMQFVVIDGTKGALPAKPEPQTEKLTTANIVCAYLALVVVVALLAAVYTFVDISVSSRVQSALSEVEATTIYVTPGDSVWSLAESHPIDGFATSDVVRWIEEKNELASSTLLPGQQIEVPSGVSA